MLTVNGKNIEYTGSTTVEKLLERLGYVFPLLIVKINSQLVERDDYGTTQVADGDEVNVVHMISGG